MELEKADISKLVAAGWKPPIPFTAKARDGVTDIYGLLYRPTRLDESRKYPIINHIYPGPQTGSIRSRAFSAARGDAQALAELGFVVVEIDGMGTPWRSKKFHEAYFGNLADNTLPDQVAAMKQLAQRYAWIDLDRAGIYGHSGGGYAAAAAMFDYPKPGTMTTAATRMTGPRSGWACSIRAPRRARTDTRRRRTRRVRRT
jgi:dipeptidyl aminopeptidase/acylaminoacyl peptidase